MKEIHRHTHTEIDVDYLPNTHTMGKACHIIFTFLKQQFW